jgi:hypothetical protein
LVVKNCQDIFTPVALQDYLARINRVIVDKIPQQCQWLFTNQEQSLFFELTMTPLITGTEVVEQVLVMGYLLEQQEKTLTSYTVMSVSPDPYQEMLSQISSKIRKTLNLETIWQETVNSLGKKLDVSRCLLIYCDAQNQELEVKPWIKIILFNIFVSLHLLMYHTPRYALRFYLEPRSNY